MLELSLCRKCYTFLNPLTQNLLLKAMPISPSEGPPAKNMCAAQACCLEEHKQQSTIQSALPSKEQPQIESERAATHPDVASLSEPTSVNHGCGSTCSICPTSLTGMGMVAKIHYLCDTVPVLAVSWVFLVLGQSHFFLLSLEKFSLAPLTSAFFFSPGEQLMLFKMLNLGTGFDISTPHQITDVFIKSWSLGVAQHCSMSHSSRLSSVISSHSSTLVSDTMCTSRKTSRSDKSDLHSSKKPHTGSLSLNTSIGSDNGMFISLCCDVCQLSRLRV